MTDKQFCKIMCLAFAVGATAMLIPALFYIADRNPVGVVCALGISFILGWTSFKFFEDYTRFTDYDDFDRFGPK